MTAADRPFDTSARRAGALAVVARLATASTAAARRVATAARSFADAGQLGPAPEVTISRWTGGRI
jgi:hypothetical protein